MRSAMIFYAIALTLAVIVMLAQPILGEGVLIVTMLTPAIAALAMLLLIAPEGGLRQLPKQLALNRAGLKGWPLALTAPLGIHIAGILVLSLSGLAIFALPPGGASIDLVLDLLINLIIGTLLALSEEIGWRGYMLPRLAVVGVIPAMLLTGFLHGFWHLPILLGTAYYHPGGNSVLVVLLFLITLTLVGIFYGYLRLWTGSVWPVAIAHGAANVGWQMFDRFNTTKTTLVQEYIGGESGAVVIIGLLAVCAVLIPIIRRPGFVGHLAP
jgi:uncharacterized protein